jgi:methyltransferase
MILSVLILVFATVQRLVELAIAQRNTRRLMAQGAVETGAEHYPVLVGLHAAWLVGLWWLAWDRPANLAMLAVYAVIQVFRVWTMVSLGARWTTRIITLAGAPRVRRGPYRFIPHPNYAVVAAEILVLPLVFGLTSYAVVFTLLNGSVLFVRIRAEERALREADAPD